MSFLVVHVGAGNHLPRLKDAYRKLLKSALHTRSFVDASTVIENSHLTNTGYGSALDKLGNASCDCTIVLTQNEQIDVLSLIGIDDKKHPTKETLHIKKELDKELGKSANLGLLTPTILQYSLTRELGSAESTTLVLPGSLALFEKYKDLPEAPPDAVQDTVGVLHLEKEFSMSTSSGGTFLKRPGRVSCAAVYGSGLAVIERNGIRVSCLCTGNGDDIIRMRLAGLLVESLLQEAQNQEFPDFSDCMVQTTLEESRKVKLSGTDHQNNPMVYVGALAVIEQGERKTLAYCHSTESFYFGFVDRTEERTIVQSTRADLTNVGTFVSGQYKL